MFFKKRKSRKELFQENKELKEKIDQLNSETARYRLRLIDLDSKLETVRRNIKIIGATCIGHDHENNDVIKEEISYLLAKELIPYITYENYVYAQTNEFLRGEVKYIGTIKIVVDEIRV